MSEYQYYEFRAVDRPLDKGEMAELRALSTRATITPTSFVNEYHWGDFKGNPSTLMERYFDAFLYFANWGTHWFMLRLPRALLDLETATLYCSCEAVTAWEKGDYVILEFRSEDESGDWYEDEEGSLSSLIPLRAEIASGDLRSLYLGWLLCAQNGEMDEDDREPPVPPGLGDLSASLRAFADFLRVDSDLIEIAAQRSASASTAGPLAADLQRWIVALPDSEKNELLLRLAEGSDPHLRAELLQRFRSASTSAGITKEDALEGRRTVGELLASAEARAAARQREIAEREARERARRQREQAAARAKYLDTLAPRKEEVWNQVEAHIETKRPKEYEEAVRLLKDLRDLEAGMAGTGEFEARLGQLRDRHAKKPSLIERLDRAGLVTRSGAASRASH